MNVETNVPGFMIRPVTPRDVHNLMDLVCELAVYEKLEHEVVGTEKDWHQALFSTYPSVEAVIGEYKGQAVAMAIFCSNFSTFLAKPGIHLEDLFVKKQFRRKGFGLELLKYLAKLTLERDYGRLEWNVLDWNQPAIDFYKKLGAKPMEEWTTFRLSGSTLDKLSSL